MKITDTLITTLFKHGAIVDMKNFETTIPLDPNPNLIDAANERRVIKIKADNIQFKLEKEDM